MAPSSKENQLIQSKEKKKELKGRAHDVKNQDASEGQRQGPTQGFNLLESKLSPN
jgi:F0F1-type ATP synthase assembly protein I